MSEKCEVCRYAGRTKVENGSSLMSRLGCRKRAPVGDGNQGRWQWPPVEHNDWCGDFNPLEKSSD